MGGHHMRAPATLRSFSRWLKTILLERLLTRKQKRILFLTRVYINTRKRQVQNVMDLLQDESLYDCVDNVQNKDVFDLPFKLYEAMWGEDDPLNPETVQDAEAFERECNAIFKSMPAWMMYGRQEDRMADIEKIYQRVNSLSTT